MIIREVRKIRGKNYNYTYSDTGTILRCGELRYVNAADPIDVEKHYFEDGVYDHTPEEGAEDGN